VFEIGKVFRQSSSNYLEGRLLTVLFADSIRVKDSLATLLSTLGITNFEINKELDINIKSQIVGKITHTSYSLITDQLIKHVKPYSGIISEFAHTTSLDLSLLVPNKYVYADIANALSLLKVHYLSITCKDFTVIDVTTNNYLLTATWDATSKSIDSDKELILSSLQKQLKITSKS
jgi:hypothetical protein